MFYASVLNASSKAISNCKQIPWESLKRRFKLQREAYWSLTLIWCAPCSWTFLKIFFNFYFFFRNVLLPFHCWSRNYATPRLSAEVAFVRPEKEEQSDWLVWPNDSFYWPRLFILQTDEKSIQCFQKHAKLIENLFSRSKVQLTRVWELLTRRWNAWHWESHCVFTAGVERVKDIFVLQLCES
jgi:hypothetical protein